MSGAKGRGWGTEQGAQRGAGRAQGTDRGSKLRGAVYFVEMDAAGGKGTRNNAAGAKYGTGYCDAQCPHDIKWAGGEANLQGQYGMCCVELDIFEANGRASAFTTHPCQLEGSYRCEGTSCGDGDQGERYRGVCDKDGCAREPSRGKGAARPTRHP